MCEGVACRAWIKELERKGGREEKREGGDNSISYVDRKRRIGSR